MKKIFIITILLIMLPSCGKREENITIEFMTLQLSPLFDDYFKGLIHEYEENNPGIKIKWIDVPYDAGIQKLMSSVAAGNPPDVINLSCDFLAKFNGMKALINFRDYLPADSINIFLPNALKLCKSGDKVTALPWYLNTYAVIYNKVLLEEAKLNEKDVPLTFDQLLSFIKKYKDITGKHAIFWNIGKDSYLPMMLGSEGIDMVDSQMTKACFNSPEGITLISKWIDLYKEGYLPKDCIIKPGSTIIESYQSGQTAIVFTGPVFLRDIKVNAYNIYKGTGIAPPLTGRTGAHELAAMCLTILKTSKHKKESVKFCQFVANAKNQLAFSKLAPVYPAVISTLNDEYFTKELGTLESKARTEGAKYLYSAGRLRKFLEHPKFDLLRDAFDEAIQNAALGKLSVKEALDNAAVEWNEILKEND